MKSRRKYVRDVKLKIAVRFCLLRGIEKHAKKTRIGKGRKYQEARKRSVKKQVSLRLLTLFETQ